MIGFDKFMSEMKRLGFEIKWVMIDRCGWSRDDVPGVITMPKYEDDYSIYERYYDENMAVLNRALKKDAESTFNKLNQPGDIVYVPVEFGGYGDGEFVPKDHFFSPDGNGGYNVYPISDIKQYGYTHES